MAARDVEMMLEGLGPMPSGAGAETAEDVPAPGADEGLELAAGDLAAAVQAGDAKGIASAFRTMFELLEMQPHAEAELEIEGE